MEKTLSVRKRKTEGGEKMDIKQISLFSDEMEVNDDAKTKIKLSKEIPNTSKRMLEAFNVSEIPFFECNFENLYPKLASIVPEEAIHFDVWGLEIAIACETVCAAICHQMNWDYLRHAVFEKTCSDIEWVSPDSLSNISSASVTNLFSKYNKPERIRANERTVILRQVGNLAKDHGGFSNLFFDVNGSMLPEEQIHRNFYKCEVFSQDPEEKKLQLLFQKLSNYTPFLQLAHFCKPAVDYHLIRCYLRRGLISPKNKLGKEFIFGSSGGRTERKESTIGALRQLCSILVQRISSYTNLSINAVNQVEWHVGRSVCTEGMPDCNLENPDLTWLRAEYNKCPFYSSCCAAKYNHDLLYIEEPLYKGTSY